MTKSIGPSYDNRHSAACQFRKEVHHRYSTASAIVLQFANELHSAAWWGSCQGLPGGGQLHHFGQNGAMQP
jgi:hypothetical protein